MDRTGVGNKNLRRRWVICGGSLSWRRRIAFGQSSPKSMQKVGVFPEETSQRWRESASCSLISLSVPLAL